LVNLRQKTLFVARLLAEVESTFVGYVALKQEWEIREENNQKGLSIIRNALWVKRWTVGDIRRGQVG
jgi:hypothetical protein